MLNRYLLSRDIHDFFSNFDEVFSDAFGDVDFGQLENGNRKVLPVSTAVAGVPTRTASLSSFYPAVETFTREGSLVLQAELPGVDPADVEVTVDKGRLVIRGEKKSSRETDEAQVHVRETRQGSFERAFMLPEDAKVEEIVASLENGVLQVTVPIKVPEPARRIAVAVDEGSKKLKK